MKKVYFLLAAMLLCSTMGHALTISTGSGFAKTTLHGDTTIRVTEAQVDLFDTNRLQMGIKGDITVTSEQLIVEITRSEAGLDDELCVGNCAPGNKELTQKMTFMGNYTGSWYTHYTPVAGKEYTVTYKFIDGTETLTLTVVYDYNTSALEDVHTTSAARGVYTIFGQKLREDSDVEGLPAGMYIVAGKKMVIR